MKLKEVINANEIVLETKWFFQGYEGDLVFIKGYLGPLKPGGAAGYEFGKKKLSLLLKDKEFELYRGEFWEAYGKEVLVCDVYLDGSNIKNYFPEFKN